MHGIDVTRGTHEDVRDWFRSYTPHYDLVIHCAAVVGGRAKIDGDPLAVASNLGIDAEMFRWAIRTKPDRVVYFSSSAAYPIALQNPDPDLEDLGGGRRALREADIELDVPRLPDATYGWAKLTGERLAAHAREAGVPVTVLRPFSGYGADQALDYPFPSFIERARAQLDPFEVWGDGTQVRDWVHVDDVVGATLACIDEGVDGPLNISTGRATSFAELAAIVTTAAAYEPEIRYRPDAPTGVQHRVGDPTLLHAVYKPTITIEEGVDRALRLARQP